MELVIDGYNVIRQSPVFKKAEQEGLEVGSRSRNSYQISGSLSEVKKT